MDIVLIRRQARLAAQAIAKGRGLQSWVSDQKAVDRQFKIETALVRGSANLHELIYDEDLQTFENAFARIGVSLPSWQMDECCQALLRKLEGARL
jgi:hypothetical protein